MNAFQGHYYCWYITGAAMFLYMLPRKGVKLKFLVLREEIGSAWRQSAEKDIWVKERGVAGERTNDNDALNNSYCA
jgi:hypothetical protein